MGVEEKGAPDGCGTAGRRGNPHAQRYEVESGYIAAEGHYIRQQHAALLSTPIRHVHESSGSGSAGSGCGRCSA